MRDMNWCRFSVASAFDRKFYRHISHPGIFAGKADKPAAAEAASVDQ